MCENFLKRRNDVLGNNDLEVGAWWPQQLCVLSDGAHGSPVSGISGKESSYAYSIVM